MKYALIVFTFSALAAFSAQADDDRYPPVSDPLSASACGECHMAFQPQMLPARSWKAIMQGLDDHFGEDATVDAASVSKIESYLVANAGDVGWDNELLRGVKSSSTPLRISELPKWIHEHSEELPANVWSRPDVGSKANCRACHKAADKGYYED